MFKNDTILWDEESNNYTQRSISNNKISDLFQSDEAWISYFKEKIDKYKRCPKSFLDIGCGYGRVTQELVNYYSEAQIYAIDPGSESIEIAKKNIQADNVTFFTGYSHDLPLEDNSIDIIVLRMVLQWIPRNKLFQTISEIDRVLKVDGIIYIQDFLTHRPTTSKSHHNNLVYVFKENYPDYFLSSPWYKEVFREVNYIEEGEDHQRHTSIIRKHEISDVYLEKDPTIEKKKY